MEKERWWTFRLVEVHFWILQERKKKATQTSFRLKQHLKAMHSPCLSSLLLHTRHTKLKTQVLPQWEQMGKVTSVFTQFINNSSKFKTCLLLQKNAGFFMYLLKIYVTDGDKPPTSLRYFFKWCVKLSNKSFKIKTNYISFHCPRHIQTKHFLICHAYHQDTFYKAPLISFVTR